MEGSYPLHFGSRCVGNIRVIRQGLYYQFLGRCDLTGDVVCRVTVCCGNVRENLGILVPENGGFGLQTRLPAKRFPESEPVFEVLPSRSHGEEIFVPICPEEPFAYLQRLQDAFLQLRNGQIGAVFPEK